MSKGRKSSYPERVVKGRLKSSENTRKKSRVFFEIAKPKVEAPKGKQADCKLDESSCSFGHKANQGLLSAFMQKYALNRARWSLTGSGFTKATKFVEA